jgi:CIC family chloride channel protein
MVNPIALFLRAVSWLKKNLSRTQFLVLAGVTVGVTAGCAGILLKTAVHFLRRLTGDWLPGSMSSYLYAVLPLAGIVLTVLVVQRAFGGSLGRGIADVLFEIAQKSAFVRRAKMYSHLVSSAITVGLGGSAGLEAPIVITGAAIGSNFARVHRLGHKDRVLLLAAGSAAGIAAIFNAPIAGVMFAIEVLLLDATVGEMIPLIIASVSGALCARVILREDILLAFTLQQSFNYVNVPWYMLLGALCGLMSLYYARVFGWMETAFLRWKGRPYLRGIAGGALVALLCFVFPPLLGEGYDSVRLLAANRADVLLRQSIFAPWSFSPLALPAFFALIALLKAAATAATLGSGGSGGNFGPSLFVGAFTGFVFAHGINLLTPGLLPVGNFAIVGMAGILSGVMYAPLTGIFLIAEVTGGYELIIPLMIVSSLSYLLVRHFEPFSMETKRFARKGHIFTGDTDRNILSLIDVAGVVERDIQAIHPDTTLGAIVRIIAGYRRNMFAVTGPDGELLGLVTLDSLREIMFQQELYDTIIAFDIMRDPPAVIRHSDGMRAVMKKFDETQSWNLPVLQDGRFAGFVSKSALFDVYRDKLREHFSAEHEWEQVGAEEETPGTAADEEEPGAGGEYMDEDEHTPAGGA